MIGIVIATDLEAAPFLAWSSWQSVSEFPFKVFKGETKSGNAPMILIVSGMGKVAAAVATHLLICRYGVEEIINPGICGALRDASGYDVGMIFRICDAIEGDRQEGARAIKYEKCASGRFEGLPQARLVTCDRPVFDAKWKTALSSLGDLVDMEGAAIVRVANMFALPCCLIKGITDRAEDGDRQVLIKNFGIVSRKLAALFEKFQP